MSIWAFLWKVLWREAGLMVRVLQIAFIPIPAAISAGVGFFGGEWSKGLLPWWGWAIGAALALVVALFWGTFWRAYTLEKDLEPKLRISGPFETKWPKTATGKAKRWFYITIENLSKGSIKDCRVKEFDLVNTNGNSSGVSGRIFKNSKDRYSPTGDNSFDLNGLGDSAKVDIAEMDETVAGSNVNLCYAARSLNSIPRSFFPHMLTIHVTAANLPNVESRTYVIDVDANGYLICRAN